MTIRSYGVGGSRTDTRSERIVLAAAPTATNYDTLENGGTNYQVPSGQVLIIDKVIFNVSGAGASIRIGYGDAAVDIGAAPAGAVLLTQQFIGAGSNISYELNVCIPIPADKYPFAVAATDSVKVTVFGQVSA